MGVTPFRAADACGFAGGGPEGAEALEPGEPGLASKAREVLGVMGVASGHRCHLLPEDLRFRMSGSAAFPEAAGLNCRVTA
jgi:hypothetical protein